jgi:hypothetical protein
MNKRVILDYKLLHFRPVQESNCTKAIGQVDSTGNISNFPLGICPFRNFERTPTILTEHFVVFSIFSDIFHYGTLN